MSVCTTHLSDKYGVGRQDAPQLGLDVLQRGGDPHEHVLGDAGVAGEVVDDGVGWQHQRVVHLLQTLVHHTGRQLDRHSVIQFEGSPGKN